MSTKETILGTTNHLTFKKNGGVGKHTCQLAMALHM